MSFEIKSFLVIFYLGELEVPSLKFNCHGRNLRVRWRSWRSNNLNIFSNTNIFSLVNIRNLISRISCDVILAIMAAILLIFLYLEDGGFEHIDGLLFGCYQHEIS